MLQFPRQMLVSSCEIVCRECNGIKTILKLIGEKGCPRPLTGLLAQTITVLAVGNEINQDNVRCAPHFEIL